MAIICPTITAFDVETYKTQLSLVSSFASRIHIDLMDGDFTPTYSPKTSDISLQSPVMTDIHVMFRHPESILDLLIGATPHLVTIHAECDADIPKFAAQLREHNIKTGIALLPETSVDSVAHLFPHIQHVLIFGGHLGYHGGKADLEQLTKINEIKKIHKHLEFGWDGGANRDNVLEIAQAGVDAINVGSGIHKADNPAQEYTFLTNIVS